MRLIDADALIPMMKYATTDSEIGVFPIKIGFNEIEKVINEQPTIESERKKGEWIDQDDGAFYPVECSECRKIPLFDVDGDYVLSNFCPNCGADMRGADE